MYNRFGEYEKEVGQLISILRPTIDITLKGQQILDSLSVHTKTDHSPVSICDLASQTLIVKGIKEHFPNDFILAEEDPNLQNQEFLDLVKNLLPDGVDPSKYGNQIVNKRTDNMKRLWVIDPIDGTYDFIKNGNYAIATALLIDNQVVCSIVAWPRHQSSMTGIPLSGPLFFVSAKGHGSFAIDLDNHFFELKRNPHPQERLIVPKNISQPERSAYDLLKERLNIHDEFSDSSLTKGFVLAAGAGVAYLRIRCKGNEFVWDIAPFELLVREAGGFATTIDGKPIEYSNDGFAIDSCRGLIMTSKDEEFHQKVLEIYREAYSRFYQ